MNASTLELKNSKIKDLIAEYEQGRLVVPEFQRDYVWKPGRAPQLLDSLYKGWPISSLLIWQNEDGEIEARRAQPRPRRGAARWLIDGQQRVITLARIRNGNDGSGIEVVFNHQTEEFARANAATRQDQRWVPLTTLWDDEDYRHFTRDLGDDARGRKIHERCDRVRAILDYEVPIVEMLNHEFKDAVGAFTRINTLGYRLKKHDIESAQVAAKHSGFIRGSVAPFLKRLHEEGFTRLHVMHLFRACALVAHPDGRNRTPLHELERQRVESAWTKTERATRETLAIVRSEFGLVDMSILWSGALLVPVIALCAVTTPRNRNVKEMAAWVALAALHHRYSGAADTALDEDLRACRTDDPVRTLLGNLRKGAGALRAEPDHFAGRLADRSALFASWVACKSRGAKDLLDQGNVILQPAIDRHHILPRSSFERERRPEADTLANIAFVSGRTNRTVSDDAPAAYLAAVKVGVLRSQCIPEDRGLWQIEKGEEFWQARRSLLAKAFNEFLDQSLGGRRLG
jgi:hypothetical protein